MGLPEDLEEQQQDEDDDEPHINHHDNAFAFRNHIAHTYF